jgi:deoxyadenosine/deoxycytidine kinase
MDLRGKHIAIEGVIGVGKTSLARLLSERTGARLLLEAPDANPFLENFYKDQRRFALPAQLFFLVSRYHELKDLRQPDLFHNGVVSDYLFQKDRIFANLNLNDQELALYDQVAVLLEREVPPPLPGPDSPAACPRQLWSLREKHRHRTRRSELGRNADASGQTSLVSVVCL